MRRVLLLAGTAEARALAGALAAQPLQVTASLAGATRAPLDLGVATRVGGFGGVAGLCDYLRAEDIAAIVDATHPFAAQMSAHAAAARRETGVPLVHLRRPEWQAGPGDDWAVFADLEAAAAALPKGARAFLGTGRGSASAFLGRTDTALTLRVIDPPEKEQLAPHIAVLEGRAPFTVEEEIETFQRLGTTHLVVKNAGGTGGFAKLAAARQLGLPVLMVARPPVPEGVAVVESVGDALSWVVSGNAPEGA